MRLFTIAMGLIFCFSGIIGSGTARATGSIAVIVSIVPQKYFVEKIGGDIIKVSIMVPPGASPATYEPKPAQMHFPSVTGE